MSRPKSRARVYRKVEGDKIVDYMDFRGSQNLDERPDLLCCDFCDRSSDRLWRRQARAFEVELWPKRSMRFDGGRWNACVYCNPMVDAQDVRLLVARVVTMNAKAASCPESGWVNLYTALFANTHPGPAELWQSGEVFELRPGS